jgi:hypothetical protein
MLVRGYRKAFSGLRRRKSKARIRLEDVVDTFWTSLWQQFGAAIDMLENAIRACPGEVWSNPSKRPDWVSDDVVGFWYVAYHALFLDYLLPSTLMS